LTVCSANTQFEKNSEDSWGLEPLTSFGYASGSEGVSAAPRSTWYRGGKRAKIV